MSLILECPQYIRKLLDVRSGDNIHISIRIGSSNSAYIVIYDGQSIRTFSTEARPGLYEYDYEAINDGQLAIRVLPTDGNIVINEILICNREIERCEDIKITNLRSFIELEGTPRQPINIFNGFLRVTYRDPTGKRIQNIRVKSTNKSSTIAPVDCTKPGVGDYWKSQLQELNILDKQLTTSAINSARNNGLVSIANRNNWLWSIPASSKPIAQDYLAIEYDTIEILGVIEKIEVFLLVNKISFANMPQRYSACTNGYLRPDPAYDITITISYQRTRKNVTTNKSFSITQDLNTLYNIILQDDENPDDKWDTFSNYLYGIKQSNLDKNAKWMSFSFDLDKLNGKGLDQCTEPNLPPNDSVIGELSIPIPTIEATGLYRSKCDADINLETIVQGSSINAVDSYKLPPTQGGSYRLGYIVNGVEEYTDDIPYDSSPEEIRDKLEEISFIDNKTHIRITGSYILDFQITYINNLAGYNPPQLIVDAENLQGASFYEVKRTQIPTFNDIQIITKIPATTQQFTIKIGGQQTQNIRHNVSLQELTSAIESLEIVGTGNVKVSGNTTSNTADYQGPWTIEFIGELSGSPIPDITISQLGYIVTRYNTGGEPKYEKHSIRYRATGGTYTLTFIDPNTGNSLTTPNIDYDIDASGLLTLINSIPWIGSITIELNEDEDLKDFIIEYIDDGTGAGPQQLMPLPIMDGNNLTGGQVESSRLVTGSGNSEETRLTILRARGGSFTLSINGVSTTPIPYNTTAEGLESQLKSTTMLQYSDVQVVEGGKDQFIIYTGIQAGNVVLAANTDMLLCDPLFLPVVPEPDYEYKLPDCLTDEDVSLMYKGALLCKPGDVYEEEPTIPIEVSDLANVSTIYNITRDLFKPYQGSDIRSIALSRNYDLSDHSPYLIKDGNLIKIQFHYVPNNKDTIVIINNSININAIRKQLFGSTIHPSRR